MEKIEFKTGLTKLRNINCPVILVDPKDIPDWETYVGNKKLDVTLSPACPEHSQGVQSQEPDHGWVRVVTVESGFCIICHKKLFLHSLSELADCRRDARRKFQKLEKGLREILAHIETEIDIQVQNLEAKHTPQGDQTGVKKEET